MAVALSVDTGDVAWGRGNDEIVETLVPGGGSRSRAPRAATILRATMAASITFDAVLVAALARELDERLRGARLRALSFDRPGRALVLIFREGTLRFGLHPEAGTVGWHDPVEPTRDDRPLSARLRSVEALTDDRVLRLLSLIHI